MRLATLGGTGAFITTATMAVITDWVNWVTALPERLGIGGYFQQMGPQNMSRRPWNDPECTRSRREERRNIPTNQMPPPDKAGGFL